MFDPRSQKRLNILARMVVQSPKKTIGRTQLMKLFYFLQEWKEVPLDYDFRIFSYGPFDSEVLSDLANASVFEIVKEEIKTFDRGYSYDITPEPPAFERSEKLHQTDPELAAKVDEVVHEFVSFGAGELELRSTIFFADQELSRKEDPLNVEKLLQVVRNLKPYLSEEIILNRILEMLDKKMLRCIATTPVG